MMTSVPLPPGDPPQICIPVKLEAFIFNRAVCDTDKCHLAPITQPAYIGVRLDPNVIRDDLQDHFDLHSCYPPEVNNRLYRLDTGELRRNRCGVYVHWSIPRFYRTGVASTQTGKERENIAREQRGFPASSGDVEVPQFVPIPNRWLVTRRLDLNSLQVGQQQDYLVMNGLEFQSWVVESDRLSTLDELPGSIDLEVDRVPFVAAKVPTPPDGHLPDDDGSAVQLQKQAETFIGFKDHAEIWAEGDYLRADLTTLSSSNQLFADFQQHNTNVFSIVDNFSYPAPDGTSLLYLDTAIASYSVIGWHSDSNDDPFYPALTSAATTLGVRMASCKLELKAEGSTLASEDPWLGQAVSTRSLCHGRMFNVRWNIDNKPATVIAEDLGAEFSNNIAIGTTALDALLAYLQNVIPQTRLDADLLKLSGLLMKQDDTVDGMVEAADVLYNHNFAENVGGINWQPSGKSPGGGSFMTVAGDDQQARDQSLEPPVTEETPLQILTGIDVEQRALDVAIREKKSLQWQLFAEWWKYVCAPADKNLAKVQDLTNRLQDLTTAISTIGKDIQGLLLSLKQEKQLPTNPAASNSFFMMKDPTLLLARIQNGWPKHYLDNLLVRFTSQIVVESMPTTILPPATDYDSTWAHLKTHREMLKNRTSPTGDTIFPKDLLSTIFELLLPEFRALRPHLNQYGQPAPVELIGLPTWMQPPTAPDFHGESDWWGETQPFFPLFYEWEVAFYNLPYNLWGLEDVPQSLSSSTLSSPVASTKKLQYGVVQNLVDPHNRFAADRRLLSGRDLILPQPSYSLDASVIQLIDQTPLSEFPPGITQAELDWVKRHILDLPFISSPLSGFTNHLKTHLTGTHVKPNLREPGGAPNVMDVAIAPDGGFFEDNLSMVEFETSTTPYGTLVDVDKTYCPFKPVTHGQVEFTKLNLFDRFGQTLCGITPKARPTPPRSTHDIPTTSGDFIYPCLGDNYKPQSSPSDPSGQTPNTVKPDLPNLCRFFQVGPYINQEARINAHFVVRDNLDDPTAPPWRPTADWENPVWGWVVPNFADFGLQFFQPDGTFYREIRKGSPRNGAAVPRRWLPFPQAASVKPTQLDSLLALFDNDIGDAYLDGFMAVVRAAVQDSNHTPDDYATFMSAIIGRPLALVNTAFSIELAAEPLRNQSTGSKPLSMPFLTDDYQPDLPSAPDTPRATRPFYTFPLKLGDVDRVFDGLAAYFLLDRNHKDTIDFTSIYCYSKITPLPPPRIPITPTNFPIFTPYYVNPYSTSWQSISSQHNARLQAFGMLINPYSSIHTFSGILPVCDLKLQEWVLEQALKRITVFLAVGPLVVTQDVPAVYDPAYKIDAGDYNLGTKILRPGIAVGVPNVAVGDWAWLQPYQAPVPTATKRYELEEALPTTSTDISKQYEQEEQGACTRGQDEQEEQWFEYGPTTNAYERDQQLQLQQRQDREQERSVVNRNGGDDDEEAPYPVYNPMALDNVQDYARPRFDRTPYTALEGYLQLRGSILTIPAGTGTRG